MSLPEEQDTFEESLSSTGRRQLGLTVLFVTSSSKKGNKAGNRFIDEEPFINKREPSISKALLTKLTNIIHIVGSST